jgi:hypothetical protein
MSDSLHGVRANALFEGEGPSLVSMMRRVSRTVVGDQSFATDATSNQRSTGSPNVPPLRLRLRPRPQMRPTHPRQLAYRL